MSLRPHVARRSTTARRGPLAAGIARVAMLLAIAAGWPASNTGAQESAGALEHQVKAAFLYKFAAFVDWPTAAFARPDTPLTIAVAGAEDVAGELAQATSGRIVEGRTVTVLRVKPGDPLSGVHILFVGRTENARLQKWAQTAQPRSVLTVSESEGALIQGSVINFVVIDRRVRFEIALDSAEKSGLKLSSRLLAVARHVHTGSP